MATYAVFGDIASEFKNITFSSTTSVTDTEVETFLAQADAEIDGHIASKYLIPIGGSNTKALNLLKAISISIVSDRVGKILQVKNANKQTEQNSKSGQQMVWGRKMLEKIQKGLVTLVDDAGAQLDLSTSHDGVQSFATGLDEPHEMRKGEDQW